MKKEIRRENGDRERPDFGSLLLHMSLHTRQVAIAAGASGDMIEKVAAQMVAEKVVRIDRAEEVLKNVQKN